MNDAVERVHALGGLRSSGARALSDCSFVKEKFRRLLFGPADPVAGVTVDVSECAFVSCSVGGEFAVSHGVSMSSILFDDIRASEGMVVSSASILDGVVVRGGRKSASLWCKPPYGGDVSPEIIDWAKRGMDNVDLAIDFSGLSAPDTEVIGIPLSKLRWNPELHVAVSKKWELADRWAELALPSNSYWRMLLQRLDDFDCDEGIFSLPLPGDRNYERKREELARIEEAGILER